MISKRRQWMLLVEVLWIAIALFSAYELRYGTMREGGGLHRFSISYLPGVVAVCLLWAVIRRVMDLDSFPGGWQISSILSRVLVAVATLLTTSLALAFLTQQYYSRLVLVYFTALLTFGFIVIRVVGRALMLRVREFASRKVVILGHGKPVNELATKIANHPELMREVVGVLCPDGSELSRQAELPDRSKSVATLNVLDLLRSYRVSELMVITPLSGMSEVQKLIGECRAAGLTVSLVPHWAELYSLKTRFAEVDGIPLITMERHVHSSLALSFKRLLDVLIGVPLLIAATPILALGICLAFARNRKPFRSELRCGQNGRQFLMYRLNINRDDSALQGVERGLAALSLTELPQLWNVLRGDMSLVGPRPESADRVRHYSDWLKHRLTVKPGLTGLAQVQGLRDQNSSEEKARYDLQYIYHWSLFFDLTLLLQTLWTLATRLLSAASRKSADSSRRQLTPRMMVTETVNVNSSQSGAG